MDKIINELNTFLKGEHMAIGAYERYIDSVTDENIKKELLQIQQDHKNHSEQLAERIRQLGGIPRNNTGIGGLMASAAGMLEGIRHHTNEEVLKKAYEGEDKGIAMAEELVKGDLDTDSSQLINNILEQDHNHLRRMVHLIDELENGGSN